MKMTLPAQEVKPYISKKLTAINENLSNLEKEALELDLAYQEELEKHQRSFFRRFVLRKPEPPVGRRFWLIATQTGLQKERIKVSNILSTLDYTSEVELTDKDIEYYGINLFK